MLVHLPKTWPTIEHDAACREIAFLYSPAFEGSPIERPSIVAHDDRDISRLITVENPNGHFRCNATVVSPVHHVASYRPSVRTPEINVIHDKYWRIRGLGYQRQGLS